MEMFEGEGQSLTENMNRATADLHLGSSESAPEEGSQGEDTDDSDDPTYHTEGDSNDTATEEHDINLDFNHDQSRLLIRINHDYKSESIMASIRINQNFNPDQSRLLPNQSWLQSGSIMAPNPDNLLFQSLSIKLPDPNQS